MAKIVTITNPLTGQPAQVDQLDHTAQQIDDGLNIARGVSNPNLLDNWYFGNTVNQRGVTDGNVTNAYWIDRWKLLNVGRVTFGDGYITITADQGYDAYLRQYFDFKPKFPLTLSVLTLNGVIAATITGYGRKYFDDGSYLEVAASKNFNLYIPQGSSFSIIAIKLELGTQQTLAHQDENGVWQLNEIPDYGEQLARCQRYFQRIVVPVATSFIPVKDNLITYQCNLPAQMRAEPSVTCGTFFIANRNNDSAVFSENFVTPIKQSASVNSVIISIEKTQSNPVTVGKSGGAYVGSYYENSGTRIIDCTADL